MAEPVNIIIDIAELDRILQGREDKARREILILIDEYLRLVFREEESNKVNNQAAHATRRMIGHICGLYNIKYDTYTHLKDVKQDGRTPT